MFIEKLSDKESWYAILVKPGKEIKIREQILSTNKLEIKDLVTPEPELHKLKKETEEDSQRYKLLLGYILLKVSLNYDRYNLLLQIDDVYRFLGTIYIVNNSETGFYIPNRIPEEQVFNIKKYLNGDFVPNKNIKNFFEVGDEVEITSGDLASIKGKITQLSGNHAYISPNYIFTQSIKVPIDKISK